MKIGAETVVLLLHLSEYRETVRHSESKKRLGKVSGLYYACVTEYTMCYLVITTATLMFMCTVRHTALKYLLLRVQ